jgi:hypothetical protein
MVEKLITPDPLGQGTTVRNITDALLDAVAGAYREAAGRPTSE